MHTVINFIKFKKKFWLKKIKSKLKFSSKCEIFWRLNTYLFTDLNFLINWGKYCDFKVISPDKLFYSALDMIPFNKKDVRLNTKILVNISLKNSGNFIRQSKRENLNICINSLKNCLYFTNQKRTLKKSKLKLFFTFAKSSYFSIFKMSTLFYKS